MAAEDSLTVTIESDDATEEVSLPNGLIELLGEEDDTAPEIVADLAVSGFAERIHAAVHHSEGETDEQLAAIEDATMELFEDRFGMTYAEATGHSH